MIITVRATVSTDLGMIRLVNRITSTETTAVMIANAISVGVCQAAKSLNMLANFSSPIAIAKVKKVNSEATIAPITLILSIFMNALNAMTTTMKVIR